MSNFRICWNAFLIALSLLTKIPVPATFFVRSDDDQYSAEAQSYSIFYYPYIGFLVGATVVIASISLDSLRLLPESAYFLHGVLLLGLWVWITGAIHLDGLADSVDAMFAGHKGLNKEKVLDVFKDPRSGPMGIVALVMCLLLKASLLVELLQHGALVSGVLTAAVVSRALAGLYVAYTPYARKSGMASFILLDGKKTQIVIGAVICIAILAAFFSWLFVLVSGAVAGIFLFYWRRKWMNTIHGYTGDSVGALIEISETLVLLIIVMLAN